MSGTDRMTELEQLIEEFKRSGLRELHVRHGELEIYLSQDAGAPGLDAPSIKVTPLAPTQLPAPASAGAEPAAPNAAPLPTVGSWPAGSTVIRAPYLGTFYRSPKPGSPPFVEIGSAVEADSELCLVEVMKLFTTVRAGIAGKVLQVLASDGELVTADQPLFVIGAA